MAGRIPDSFIQELLARTDIVEVIGARVDLKRAGKEYKGLSPFTNEKSPSFFVSPAKQMFFDFSSGKNGTAISFLMEYDRLGFVEAVEELARLVGLEVPREGGHGPSRLVLEGPLDALAAAERFFRAQLRTHGPAIEYLKKRGIEGRTARLYGIGYAPDSWDALAQEFKADPAHALSAGLLKKKEETGRVFDVFRNRIMFPIRDTRGRVIAFGGRTLANDPAKYLNSPETALFHKGRNLFGLYEARQSTKSELPYLLVVEGYMDTVMLAQHGIRNVVATLGTATTHEHLKALFKSAGRVVFCFDGDRAGRSAAWRALEQALPEVHDGRECRFMFLPEGHDPDTLVQEIGADAFRARVEQALTLSDFLLSELTKQANVATRDGRARFAELARPHIERLRDGVLRRRIEIEVAQRAGVNIGDLARVSTAAAVRAGSDSAARRAEAPGVKPVRRALQLLLEKPALAVQVQHLEQLRFAPQPGIEMLLEAVEYFNEHPHFGAHQLAENWRGTAQGEALGRLLGLDAELSDEGLEREFLDCIERLRRSALRARVEAFAAKAREQSLSPAETLEWQELTRQLSSERLV